MHEKRLTLEFHVKSPYGLCMCCVMMGAHHGFQRAAVMIIGLGVTSKLTSDLSKTAFCLQACHKKLKQESNVAAKWTGLMDQKKVLWKEWRDGNRVVRITFPDPRVFESSWSCAWNFLFEPSCNNRTKETKIDDAVKDNHDNQQKWKWQKNDCELEDCEWKNQLV